MKRTGIARLGAPDEPSPLSQSPSMIQQQAGASNMHTLAQSAQPQLHGPTAMLSVGGGAIGAGAGFVRSTVQRPAVPAVINYLKPGGAVQYAPSKPPQQPVTVPPRHKPLGNQSPGSASPAAPPLATSVGPGAAGVPPGAPPPPPAGTQIQRLKVEDALSYLDQVKYKFNTQPQVYNDFLDIMKEFKSQSIDTPGVITRVSNLFKGHPELIVGFNTFLPPGYKIEVQSNGQVQVSVSMPSPTTLGAGGVLLGVHHAPQPQLVHLLPVPQSVTSAIVHNLTVGGPAPHSNTLHHISQAHQQIEAAAQQQQHHPPGSVPPPTGAHTPAAAAGQPVEFNHAIQYVNKIKSRFSRQPDKYKRFLEILHAYQRGPRDVKEPQVKQQTEQEVYAQVAKLFENQEDLLAEFGQFLPDAKAVGAPPAPSKAHHYAPMPTHVQTHARRSPPPAPLHPREPGLSQRASIESDTDNLGPRYTLTPAPPPSPPHQIQHHVPHTQITKHVGTITSSVSASTAPHHHLKRSPSFTSSSQIGVGAPPVKKPRPSVLTGATVRDVSYAEAAKYGTLQDYNFFDRVRKALHNQEVYDNFLRCLLLFTNEVISSSELLCVTSPFLCRHPELQRWLQDFVGTRSPSPTPTNTYSHTSGYISAAYGQAGNSLLSSYDRDRPTLDISKIDRAPTGVRFEPIGTLGAQFRHDRPQGDAAMDIDLNTCKRLGTSYCALPPSSAEAASRRCSGRTPLCREVLNDTWVSFPTYSEDSTFVTCRKTQYEEYIYRCEDERFELDVVIETNAATIRVLEGIQKKLSRMTAEDAAKFRLDECLGGHSPTIHQRALRRIYGDKVATDIIAGLKKNPVVAVPVVLRRLKAKEEEWREAQKGFNKQWREQNEKYYLKSLDHQGINFKQNDLKALRSKSLFNEVESAYEARHPSPHLTVDYNMRARQEAIKIVRDAAELLIHHARRQTAIQKAEKRRIKQLLRHFLPDLFNHPRQPLSDDEKDEEDKEEPQSPGSPILGDNAAEIVQVMSNSTTALTTGSTPAVKQEKDPSSESDTNNSEKNIKNNKNKENAPKHNNIVDNTKDGSNGKIGAGLKRSDSTEELGAKSDSVKSEPQDVEDDIRDAPPNEARFVCTSSWYLFLRLHGILCQRLGDARRAAAVIAEQESREQRGRHPSVALALRLKPTNAVPASECYTALLELIKGVLDGNTESVTYEDAARDMLGIRAYPAYTLDKVVSYAVRQLQHCVSEPWSLKAAEMAARGGMRAGGGAYIRRARKYLRDEHTSFLVRVYGGEECRVTFELLEGAVEGRTSPQHINENSRLSPMGQSRGNGSSGEAAARLASWSLYTERYARPDRAGTPPPRNKPVFLKRCARRCGGGDAPARAAGVPDIQHPAHARRKPPKIVDGSECTLAQHARLRLLAARPHCLYRRGALKSARDSHARLHAARRARFRAWLRRHNSEH